MQFPLLEIIMALGLNGHVDPIVFNDAEVKCLAQNIYYEARGEPLAGQQAVAHVTLNRVEADSFPDSVCGVVFQRSQFSWTKNSKQRIAEKKAYDLAMAVAVSAMIGLAEDPTRGATYFHGSHISPRWSRKFKATATIGKHIFKKDTRL